MLANSLDTDPQVGTFSKDVHLPATSLHELLNFIADELPRWRDRPERKSISAEDALTSQLCGHLNSAARLSKGWDILQFRREETDEKQKGRTIDLIAAPCAVRVWIHGRCYYDLQTLLPIECKRLPTPKGKKRDEREYVFTQYASTGGIQRFKAGDHGSEHTLGAMIAYVQNEPVAIWYDRVTKWIKDLGVSAYPAWSANDFLHLENNNLKSRMAIYHSSHTRANGLPDIELRHLWIEM